MLGQLRQNEGFTLVEMALVLIIIGIIIGAIVKGNDLVRSAEQKRIYSKFLSDWRLGYMNFYDRTGKILGDTYNGTAATPGVGQDGRADSSAGAGTTPVLITGQNALVDSTVTAYLGLADVGLRPPTTNILNTAYQYRYVDSQGTSHTLDIAFAWDATSNFNYLRVTGIPGELGMAIDTMIDGEADGTLGDFINSAADGATAVWPAPTTETTARWRMQF
jgi:prepilin-type N-terminal cleavage/methylation domain-containing protein